MAEASEGTVLVTGGAKGIGRTIADAAAAAGWDVVLWGRDRNALLAAERDIQLASGQKVSSRCVDLSVPGSASEAFRALVAERGVPRGVVCNAGDYGPLGRFADGRFAAWKQSFDLNFFAAAELLHAYLGACAEVSSPARRKVVVVGGSGLGGARVWPGISAYATAKAALYRLVEVLHEEVYAAGIDINCLAPGAIKTGITEQAVAAGSSALGELHRVSVGVLEGKGDSTESVAEAIGALLGPRCDGLSGRLISAKWDRPRLTHADEVRADPDLLRLRRIDNELYSRGQKP